MGKATESDNLLPRPNPNRPRTPALPPQRPFSSFAFPAPKATVQRGLQLVPARLARRSSATGDAGRQAGRQLTWRPSNGGPDTRIGRDPPGRRASRWYCYIGHVRTYRDPEPASERRPSGQHPRGGQGACRGRGPAGYCPGGFVAWQPAAGVRVPRRPVVPLSRWNIHGRTGAAHWAFFLLFSVSVLSSCSRVFLLAKPQLWSDRKPRIQGTTRGGRGKGQGPGIEEYLGSEAPRKKDSRDRGM
ncbi:hypothetical protein BGZ61DRAFT_71101 [Ilyonectria robusta]|uniref:uncharacterized protein n=1 Tax=Ilyonectria robusta TaxID=1079257 RepID=UPI001E8E5327|nr:uncharacterized protein BGZ61DRAFT_71101 [Ilyonectria robusta]KAH8676919.1 hypothetical protein BGZ61DRAFT_71101 [Ilyonectria robusta]